MTPKELILRLHELDVRRRLLEEEINDHRDELTGMVNAGKIETNKQYILAASDGSLKYAKVYYQGKGTAVSVHVTKAEML